MDMSQPFEVPFGRQARGRVTAPPSKSHAIRALVCASLAEGTSTLHGLSRCDAEDIRRTIGALGTLGFKIDGDTVTGAGGRIPRPEVTLDLGGSATAFRFLAAVAALGPGPTTLTGDASLRARPMDSIVEPLRAMKVTVLGEPWGGELPPIVVQRGPPRAVRVEVDAAATSQALSALLLIGPALRDGLEITPAKAEVSGSYVVLTRSVMSQFGSTCLHAGGTYRGLAGGYRPWVGSIEGDWSGGSYPLAAGAVSGGDVEVDSVDWESRQADVRIVSLLRLFGAGIVQTPPGVRVRGGDRRPLDVNLRSAPDLAPLVGALGCVAEGTTRVRGAAHLRIKESDRIATVVAAARALGCEARELPDGFEIDGPAKHGGLVETQHDHRIAMAFAVAGFAIPGVVIDDPACVAKSYPRFWEDLLGLVL